MEIENVIEIEVDASEAKEGLSAYEVYLKNGGALSETEWLESLKGEDGKDGVDGAPGKDGENGENGITPTIGENGNWFIGDIDTGVSSKGPQGEPGSVKFIVVNELPTENIDETAIYMKPNDDLSSQNTYDEYIYVNNNWEMLGTVNTEIDLSDYYTKKEVDNITGSLEDLSTEDKSNIVSAINESLSKGIRVLTKTTNLYELEDQFGIYKVSEDVSNFINVRLTTSLTGRSQDVYPGEVFIWAKSIYGSAYVNYFIKYRHTRAITYDGNDSNYCNLFIAVYPNNAAAGREFTIPLNSLYNIREINNTINGLYTYNTLPETSVTPTTDNQMVNKKYVDDAIANVSGGEVDLTDYYTKDEVDSAIANVSGGGTEDYTDLNNKPSINDVTLEGNKTLDDLGIQAKGDYALKSELPTNTVSSTTVTNIVQLSQTEYDALSSKDSSTLYIILG